MATRPLHTDVSNATDDDRVAMAVFCAIEYPDGNDIHVWSGSGTYSWNSESWTGMGHFGEVEAIEETTAQEAPSVKLKLTHVAVAGYVADVLNVARVGYPVRLWLGFFNPDTYALIGDPEQIYEGETGSPEIMFDQHNGAVVINTDNVEIDMDRPRRRRYTPEDMKRRAFWDTGARYVASLQEREIRFGS